ncbi:MAG: hypothetical protein F4Y60_12035 [Boseongicola sp. SB0664_bin_43]|uniref:Uncharacterized protein n=1 Tax=Boseongicola sp. SB0664_bin_43 TaxID=2604844 RepID=A0A6B0Y1Z5_9RHOB|nr:hypothetical protein [Boseongicola sp. SB0664_bin_43]MYK30448.1 hypothetical protein [Boseongicola sp. SB0670_bin_30]
MLDEANAWNQRLRPGHDTTLANVDGHRNQSLAMTAKLSARRGEVVTLPADPSKLVNAPALGCHDT